jgi:hypothetical protein
METKIEHRRMTEEEKLDTLYEAVLLQEAGREEEATVLIKSVPLEPYLAEIFKEVYGADFLIRNNYNLLEVEDKFGKNWLNR